MTLQNIPQEILGKKEVFVASLYKCYVSYEESAIKKRKISLTTNR
ncbi:hypothetical protein ACFDTO_36340 [Microbacteriaceae bacterium 4G12]